MSKFLPEAVVIGAALFAWIIYFRYLRRSSARGIITLLLTLFTFFSFERFLHMLPDQYFPAPPILVPPDKGNEVFEKNGFRGRRPCRTCGDDLIRIVTMGGSSTFGIPLYYSQDTYSAELQRILSERRLDENYEVLNGGIAGYGIMQILDSIENQVLKAKPDIITICAWFNDSSSLPSWYGFADKSDKESYEFIKVISKIENIPGFKAIYGTRTFSLFRSSLMGVAAYFRPEKKKGRRRHRPRMSPEEFEWAMGKLAELAKEHDFLPVLVLEPVNRTPRLERAVKGKKYYEVMQGAAAKYGFPLIDTLEKFGERRDEWLFYDFIHTNRDGHKIMAEAIYEGVFHRHLPPEAQQFLLARNINLEAPPVKKEHFFQIEPASSKVKISFDARFPRLISEEIKPELEIVINGQRVGRIPELSADFRRKEFEIARPLTDRPITDILLRAAPPLKQNKIPGTFLTVASDIFVKSGGKEHGWTHEITVDGVSYAAHAPGYGVVIIGGASGRVLDFRHFNLLNRSARAKDLDQYLQDAAKFREEGKMPIIIAALKMDGAINADQEAIASAFAKIGGSGQAPREGESFLLIGSPEIPRGAAYEEKGYKLIEFQTATNSLQTAKLFQVKEFTQASLPARIQ